MIRVGLVGAGPWARQFHAPMVAASDRAQLTTVWARRTEAAEEVAAEFGSTPASSFDDLLARCDAVAFAVPPAAQPVLAVQAARAGKHLLLEKPLAAGVREAETIARVAGEAAVATRLMLTYRFTTVAQTFLATLHGRDVSAVTGTFVSGSALPGSPFSTPWRREPGAALFDLGPHALDLLEAAAGPVDLLTATESAGVVTVDTRHRSGAAGHLVLSVTTPGSTGPLRLTAVTTSGLVELGDAHGEDFLRVRRAIIDDFADAVMGRPSTGIDAARGVELQRLLDAAGLSARTGRWIRPHGGS